MVGIPRQPDMAAAIITVDNEAPDGIRDVAEPFIQIATVNPRILRLALRADGSSIDDGSLGDGSLLTPEQIIDAAKSGNPKDELGRARAIAAAFLETHAHRWVNYGSEEVQKRIQNGIDRIPLPIAPTWRLDQALGYACMLSETQAPDAPPNTGQHPLAAAA